MLLAAAMIVSSAVFSYADGYLDIDCQVANSNPTVGETFYVDYKVVDNENGYNNLTGYLRYDPNVIRAVECDVDDIPSDLIIYTMDNGAANSLFSYGYTNSRINFVPKSGDVDYDNQADGKKTASEIGIIKFTNYLGATVDNQLQNYTGTGTILRMKFEAVGNGSTDIDFTDLEAAYFDNGANRLSVNIASGSVNVTGGAEEPATETTTIAPAYTTTEATTSASNNNSSSSGSSGGGSNSGSSSAATTEATTVATTETSVEVTTSAANNAATVSFKDVANDAWYHDAVIELAGKKVVNGYSDNTFKPNDNVKRADFLLMLLRGMGVDTTKAPQSNFNDVAQGKYYYNAVGIAKDMGIASGDGANFNPESNITRQDMMVLAKKALEIVANKTITGDSAVLDKFNDKDSISAYAVDSLAAMVEEGIVNGMGDGIAPKANTTRAQSAVIISKIMNKL